MKLKAVVHPAEEGGYWAEIPALPGCISEGDTFDETLSSIREAAEGWLSVADQSAESDADAQLSEIEVRNDEDISS
jgi:predicted RNase H-like HicB family nuclease